jgi:hypothetical protein
MPCDKRSAASSQPSNFAAMCFTRRAISLHAAATAPPLMTIEREPQVPVE